MIIKKLTLNNFRQFKGEQKLEFSCDPQKNVTVLLGDNTFGKTTILQAFNWCLYDKAIFPKDSNPDFLLNVEVADEMSGISTKCSVYVELEIEHKGLNYIIKREQIYVDRSLNDWSPLKSELSVRCKEDGHLIPIKKEDAQTTISSILPESLSEYFFFDTERVSDISTKKDLPNAVKGLLGLAPVKNAHEHLGKRTKASTVIGKWYNNFDSDSNEVAESARQTISIKQANITKNKETINNAENELEKLNATKAEIEQKLRENETTSDLQKEKEGLETELERINKELDESGHLFKNFFNAGIINYMSLPVFKDINNQLKNAKIDDKGIREMTATSIHDLIKRGRCICGAKIVVSADGKTGNETYLHILDELKYLPPEHLGTAIRNYKNIIDSDEKSCSQFFPTINEKYKNILKLRKRKSEIEEQIDKIDTSISGKEDMSSYEMELDTVKEDIRRFRYTIATCNQSIGSDISEIESLQKKVDGLIVSSENNKKLMRYIAYAEKICEWIDNVYDKKETEIRNQLEEKVNFTFGKMYHGERIVKIDDQYHVTLLSNVNGKEMITGESEGLKRVKNFAFISGLVDLAKEKASIGSGKNKISWENEPYPLVMDAPFSNADEIHIQNISSVLPEVANQVIMFVMNKDWQYAKKVLETRVGKYCELVQKTESFTEIK